MNRQTQLTAEATEYLTRFYAILEEMISGMESAQLSDSISQNFIVQMIPHHRAAIEMSKSVLQYPILCPLRTIAENIITAQEKSIAQMEAALPQCQSASEDAALALYRRRYAQITDTMFSDMKNAPADNQISRDFMLEMIPHHRGAVEMSRNALRFPICPALRPILRAIIVSQTRGIREMEALLRDCGWSGQGKPC